MAGFPILLSPQSANSLNTLSKPCIGEPQRATLAVALKSLKQGASRRLIGEAAHFWQRRYYDFNIRDHGQFIEKLRYIHRNPVTRGLVTRPEEWRWSSFHHYLTGEMGIEEIESPWTAGRRLGLKMPGKS